MPPVTHSSHWGAFTAAPAGDELHITPFSGDPDPSPLLDNFTDVLRHPARVTRPMVRKGWLEQGPGPDARRGADEYIAISWAQALDLAARELQRVSESFGPQAVFGGSYGWSSAGRFHHAQSQVHRFLNTTIGGYVRSVWSYSSAAASVILPHIVASQDEISRRGVSWREIAEHSDIVLSFGGLALKNSQVASGGMSEHTERGYMRQAAERGAQFISISPLRHDLPDEAAGEWIPVRPGTDAALMLALLHTLWRHGLSDEDFLARYCTGWPTLVASLNGTQDGTVRDAAWAEAICGVPAAHIVALAQRLHGKRVVVTVAHSLQRAQHGEQPVWLGMVLAAALGQPGLPGGGYAYALGALGHYGKAFNRVSFPSLPQGNNGVDDFIPVARIADMLLNPGAPFDFNGQRRRYPHIKLAWWAGGNPFHHHQDLARLRHAFCQLDTLIVHEHSLTATARHADLILPATMTLEREDVGGAPTDRHVFAMHPVAAPWGESRDDFAIFRDIAARLGREEAFTEGRTVREWLQHLYGQMQKKLAQEGVNTPDFDRFWQQGVLTLPQVDDGGRMMRRFRDDPDAHPLPTPDGKIQIYSATIASFNYADCPGHPVWLTPDEQPDAQHPLWLIANQPATRLHSQLDYGRHSARHKQQGKEVCMMHPTDAAARGITEGAMIMLHNLRGAVLAAVTLSENIMPGVVQLPTGAWYDPVDPLAARPLCRHGNPNVLTRDIGTSSLGQGCSGQITVVQVSLFTGDVGEVQAFVPLNQQERL
ncbi:molybdopterin-dependent oxidoreductase [Kosakonia sp. ML.JS2a]|uniref:molybdopterin-dependent oxidoreductase n=1 Tax=Kosakonia sp. ML.JS2a TaxID=2980557 RepID=UPI0021DA35B1|nr:molybdopterin-dependent oxidoreductase [Kosakonia sp. ML.JS2a]UXY11211.1 molybdopterin-dependent oxidoreductase [Kosakonia sp. ML.JS2a]